MIDEDSVRERNASLSPHLDERGWRLFAASEAKAAGYGGIAAVSRITGRAASTIGRPVRLSPWGKSQDKDFRTALPRNAGNEWGPDVRFCGIEAVAEDRARAEKRDIGRQRAAQRTNA